MEGVFLFCTMLNWKLYLTALCIALSITACKQRTGAPNTEATADISTMHLDSLSPKFDIRFEQLDHVKIGKQYGDVWVFYDIRLHGDVAGLSTYTFTTDKGNGKTSVGKIITSDACFRKALEVIDAMPDTLYNSSKMGGQYMREHLGNDKYKLSFVKSTSGDKEGLARYDFSFDKAYDEDAAIVLFIAKLDDTMNALQYYCKE